jgi:fructose-bisphosphate aldolase class I
MSQTLSDIAKALVVDGKGILAADESSPTIKKRFDSIGVESTEDTRRDYRTMLFRPSGRARPTARPWSRSSRPAA